MQINQTSESSQSFSFGTISDRRVVYNAKKFFGLGGSSHEDIPLRHITSVGLGTNRHPIWGVVFAVIAFGAFKAGGIGIVLALVSLALAALLFWGSPEVHLNTAGTDHRFVSGPPWTRTEAERFVSELRTQLFKDADQTGTGTARWG